MRLVAAALLLVLGCDQAPDQAIRSDCDTTYAWVVDDGETVRTTTSYVARFELDVQPRDMVPIETLACTVESWSPTTVPAWDRCEPGSACTGEQTPIPVCVSSREILWVDPWTVEVPCGERRSVEVYSTGAGAVSGYRYTDVWISY